MNSKKGVARPVQYFPSPYVMHKRHLTFEHLDERTLLAGNLGEVVPIYDSPEGIPEQNAAEFADMSAYEDSTRTAAIDLFMAEGEGESANTLPPLKVFPHPEAIVAQWKRNEAGGTTRIDGAGINTLRDQNNTVGSTDGLFGERAADFEKDNPGPLSISDAEQNGLDFEGGNFTFSFWLKVEDAQSGTDIRSLIYKYTGATDRSYALYHIQEGGIHEFDLILNSTGRSGGDGHAHLPFTMPVGEWFHATITHDATNGGAAVLYINGVEQAMASTGKTSVYNGGADFTLGSNNEGITKWDGPMGVTTAWNVALSSQDVATEHAAYFQKTEETIVGPLPDVPVPPPADEDDESTEQELRLPPLSALPHPDAIVAQWKLNEAGGTTRIDGAGINTLGDQNNTVGSTDGLFGERGADFEKDNPGPLSIADAKQNGLDSENGTFTFSFWLKVEDAQSGTDIRSLIYKYTGASDRSYALYHIQEGGIHEFDLILNSTGRSGGDGHAHLPFTMPVGEWFHATITHDATNGGAAVLYINGVEQAMASTGKTSVYNGGADFTLGSNNEGITK